MTIDKDKLRALAETLINNVISSCSWAERIDGSELFRRDMEFARECSPEVIMTLLGEIDRLERKNANQVESIREYQDLAAGGERLGELRADLRVTKGERDELKAERDRLQSQVAALQAEPNSYQSGYDAGRAAEKAHADNWRAEADGLRRDASRYRFLRNQHWPVAYLAVVINPKAAVKPGHVCPSGDRLDEQVDEAMKREASHD